MRKPQEINNRKRVNISARTYNIKTLDTRCEHFLPFFFSRVHPTRDLKPVEYHIEKYEIVTRFEISLAANDRRTERITRNFARGEFVAPSFARESLDIFSKVPHMPFPCYFLSYQISDIEIIREGT